ncbi:hypothetical protein [Geomesophilobacter sediminis]|uniref:Lipoprotein n=1 Tax=Geomesophilobacter sediminis TaxID=2798584 RepID=A0A8J7JG96_9BACT|nr:hypothetical protein [Geomesophilobacter sediminis]MBJ6725649.1 hypothetical protein [Geomesophilobacter sediminis]
MRSTSKILTLSFAFLFCVTGCTTLLPSGKAVVESPWQTYAEVKDAFDKIEIGKTTVDDLSSLGFNIKNSPNIKLLSYLDVAATVQSIPIQELDPGLQACLRARSDCRAYVFEPNRVNTQRNGNFWLDIMSFRRKTQETGWRFKALIVFVNSHVAYKLSSGEPQINTLHDQKNPLGPLQEPAQLFYKIVP